MRMKVRGQSVLFKGVKTVKKIFLLVSVVIGLLIGIRADSEAADTTVVLDDAAGSSAFSVQDSASVEGAHIDSDGNMVIKGGLRLDASGAEYTTAEDLIVDGKIGIGDTTPTDLLTVGSGDKLTVNSSGNLSTSGSVTIGGGTAIVKHLSTTATWNPDSLTNGSSTGTSVTLTGVAAGDPCTAGLSTITASKWLISASVAAADAVDVTVLNRTGSTVDLASGTLRVSCWQY